MFSLSICEVIEENSDIVTDMEVAYLRFQVREAFNKKTPDFGTLSESGRGGLKNHKLFFQNLVWTFFNRGGGFCHHVQTVKS